MANWAYSSVVITGDPRMVEELYNIMSELESMKSPGLHDNGFGSTWFGNLVIKLGGDWQQIYCRGSWDNLQYSNGELQFSVESAWGELNEVRHFLEEKFPGIKIYYQTEESGMGIYITNDDTGSFFPEQFYLWVENEETTYHDSLDSLIRDIENITGCKNLKTYDSCKKALETYSRKHSDLCYTLEKFTVIPD